MGHYGDSPEEDCTLLFFWAPRCFVWVNVCFLYCSQAVHRSEAETLDMEDVRVSLDWQGPQRNCVADWKLLGSRTISLVS